MKNKSAFIGCLLAAAILVTLSGCSSVAGSAGNSDNWGNHKCKVVDSSTGTVYQGWATNTTQAKASAMHKCESKTGAADLCVSSGCVDAR